MTFKVTLSSDDLMTLLYALDTDRQRDTERIANNAHNWDAEERKEQLYNNARIGELITTLVHSYTHDVSKENDALRAKTAPKEKPLP